MLPPRVWESIKCLFNLWWVPGKSTSWEQVLPLSTKQSLIIQNPYCSGQEFIASINICESLDFALRRNTNGERFAGLNVRSFNSIEVFMEIFLCCLGKKYLLFSIIKERHLYSRENFHGTIENHEKCKSFAQQIFPCLWWSQILSVTYTTAIVTQKIFGTINVC